MGKVTGFMEFERVNETYEAPAQRIHHYKEFEFNLYITICNQQFK